MSDPCPSPAGKAEVKKPLANGPSGDQASSSSSTSKLRNPEDEVPVVVFDNGTRFTKVGLSAARDENGRLSPDAKYKGPDAEFISVVGYKKGVQEGHSVEDILVGNDAEALRTDFDLRYPVQYGIILNWPDIEQIWRHSYYNILQVDPTKHPVLLSENPLNPRMMREQMTKIMFDVFDVPSLIIIMQAVLALYAFTTGTGVILDFGAGITDIVPIFEGYAINHAIFRFNITGNELTSYLQRMIEEKVGQPLSHEDLEAVDKLKEAHCYIAKDFDSEILRAADPATGVEMDSEWKLPSLDQPITLREELFRVTEAFFEPRLASSPANKHDYEGIHQVANYSISLCESDMQRDLYSKIFLCGGGSMFAGLEDRLQDEIGRLCPSTMMLRVIASANRRNAACMGALLVSNYTDVRRHWLKRKEWDEEVVVALHRKCLL
eukprot:gnl/MRDRNA2_/MRDRNA2_140896_c0_seq1.p1 gnl/MRDRNA2_/MRDRNA2_140896_c0~~gnl/MRDRNA2_/MRDRNA2_140896_c0_seq1.p1  ORF type:complete len:435 (+),score=81.77 gnl/MRDRNA2_/MRDRNA2_140896_c0_seq1:83-1387(+)